MALLVTSSSEYIYWQNLHKHISNQDKVVTYGVINSFISYICISHEYIHINPYKSTIIKVKTLIKIAINWSWPTLIWIFKQLEGSLLQRNRIFVWWIIQNKNLDVNVNSRIISIAEHSPSNIPTHKFCRCNGTSAFTHKWVAPNEHQHQLLKSMTLESESCMALKIVVIRRRRVRGALKVQSHLIIFYSLLWWKGGGGGIYRLSRAPQLLGHFRGARMKQRPPAPNLPLRQLSQQFSHVRTAPCAREKILCSNYRTFPRRCAWHMFQPLIPCFRFSIPFLFYISSTNETKIKKQDCDFPEAQYCVARWASCEELIHQRD